jgi:hypothetical protein
LAKVDSGYVGNSLPAWPKYVQLAANAFAASAANNMKLANNFFIVIPLVCHLQAR